MNIAALAAELSLPEYTGSADDKRQQYSAKMVDVKRRVSIVELQRYMLPEGLMPVLETRALDSSNVYAQAAAKEILDYFSPTVHVDDIDVNHARFIGGLGVLKAVGDVTLLQHDAILALGTKSVHVSETKPGLPRTVLTRHVIAAIGGV